MQEQFILCVDTASVVVRKYSVKYDFSHFYQYTMNYNLEVKFKATEFSFIH